MYPMFEFHLPTGGYRELEKPLIALVDMSSILCLFYPALWPLLIDPLKPAADYPMKVSLIYNTGVRQNFVRHPVSVPTALAEQIILEGGISQTVVRMKMETERLIEALKRYKAEELAMRVMANRP